MDHSRKIAFPKPASSIMVIRDGQGGLEVLMIERAKTMKFAPGAFVFPGGKVDKADMQGWRWQGITTGRSAMRDFPYRVAALRELYEEAGILLTDKSPKRTLANATPFASMVRMAGVKLDILNMVPFAHWVTPEPMPRRFDTHFYLAPHNGDTALHDGNEAISFRWVNPRRILDDWENDRIPLMFPTRLNLMKLARATTVNEALRQARRARVIRTLPVVHMGQAGVKLTIDPATGFGVTAATPKELSVEASGIAKKA
ncbi:NUDIX hydrolase [Kordiimonas lacus]|uniref:NUDIX domain-containing protein n=1 Tax=Kordiimonas lacus TaxID=637679 RepID=A0A1G6WC86_9PROT|nr:NUDIX hydrolase [Kordiimonas lacus]SDD63293.1 NUDIX domain-containing protein [Kordiimonas lacus]